MISSPITVSMLTGKSESHLISKPFPNNIHCPIHKDVVIPYLELCNQASQNGFDIKIVSGFRSFERQLTIWNDKAIGKRAVFDSNGKQLEISTLSKSELMFSILHWTALPGASRHHWGTELDIIDKAAIMDDYQVQLIQEEVDEGGIFSAMHSWLDSHLDKTDFFRPYWGHEHKRIGKGVAREKWHLSYAPIAEPFEKSITLPMIQELMRNTQIELKKEILDNLEEIFEFYVLIQK